MKMINLEGKTESGVQNGEVLFDVDRRNVPNREMADVGLCGEGEVVPEK